MFSSNASSAASDAVFVEDVFNTSLYTGNSTSQTITNGIDLSGKGGLIWNKCRSADDTAHWLWDTNRGGSACLTTSGDTSNFGGNGTNASTNFWTPNPSNTGYSFTGSNPTGNASSETYVSWTFREQAKFFDVVTYTGDGTTNRQIAHNLGSVPGMVVFKKTSNTGNWVVWQRSIPNGAYTQAYLRLNATFDTNSLGDYGYSLVPTSTVLNTPRHTNTGNTDDSVNVAGETYVAYLFAHNAGGFGLTGNDNVISCGSFTSDGAGNATVNLGYEPQFLMYKRTDASQAWYILDTMRGWPVGSGDIALYPNTAGVEENNGALSNPTSTGFTYSSTVSATFIYVAIRKNMKS